MENMKEPMISDNDNTIFFDLKRATIGARFTALLIDNAIFTVLVIVPFYIIIFVNVDLLNK